MSERFFNMVHAKTAELRERVLTHIRRNAFGRFFTKGSTQELVSPAQQWVADGHYALYGERGQLVKEASLPLTSDTTKETPLRVTDFEAQGSERTHLIGPQNILVAIYTRIQRSSGGQAAADAFKAMILDMKRLRRERVGQATMRLSAEGWQYTKTLRADILSETDLLTESQWDQIKSLYPGIETPSNRLHQEEIPLIEFGRLVGRARGKNADEEELIVSQQIKQNFIQGLREIPQS